MREHRINYNASTVWVVEFCGNTEGIAWQVISRTNRRKGIIVYAVLVGRTVCELRQSEADALPRFHTTTAAERAARRQAKQAVREVARSKPLFVIKPYASVTSECVPASGEPHASGPQPAIQSHDWSANCEQCSRCSAQRTGVHTWQGCKCTECGMTRDVSHWWVPGDVRCVRCGKEQPKEPQSGRSRLRGTGARRPGMHISGDYSTDKWPRVWDKDDPD